MDCTGCPGIAVCGTCRQACGYLRALPLYPCTACEGKECTCRPALQYPCITNWHWAEDVRYTAVHGVVHYPPGAPVPLGIHNHRGVTTSWIRQVLSVQYGLVRTLSGSIYQLHAPSCEYGDLMQRNIVVPLDLLYLHSLLQQGRAKLHADAPLAVLWQLSPALFAVVLQYMLPYL